MRKSVLIIALGSIGLAGCQSVGTNDTPPVTGSTTPAGAAASRCRSCASRDPCAPAIPAGSALGGVLGGPVGASLTDEDRQAAWDAQVGGAELGPEALVAWG